jgi:hypothetical protein
MNDFPSELKVAPCPLGNFTSKIFPDSADLTDN